MVVYGPGQFVGELGLLTGQRTYLTARATRNGSVLVIPHDDFRRLMATKPTISDTIFSALIGRRETLRTTSGGEAVQIIGSRFSPEALALRTFAARNRLAYAWIDLEEEDDVEALLASKGLLQATPRWSSPRRESFAIRVRDSLPNRWDLPTTPFPAEPSIWS